MRIDGDSWRRERVGRVVIGRIDHGHLERVSLEFGHRVMYECLRFASIASAAGLGGTSAVLDYIVMTKLLPKVHGSRQRLETPLLALNAWTAHYESGAGEPFLPRSAAKLSRMIETLKDAQFVTFTE